MIRNSTEGTQIGGQAVIEGVMMRSQEAVAIAVRKSTGEIVVKKEPYSSLTQRIKFLGLPILRGAVVLIETIAIGIKALTYSGNVAMEEEKKKIGKVSAENKENKTFAKIWLILTVLFSLALGLLIFFYLPLVLTDLLGVKSGFLFNLVDGIIRLLLFLSYLFLITKWKEIRRIFQYHGAEHKSIFTFEDKKELTVENAKQYSTSHPRCGTAFLLIVIVMSIFIFILLGRPTTLGDRLLRLLFVPLIGGISYELIKLSGKKYSSKLAKILIVPGLWLQKITAKEPDDSQVEVALVALKSILGKEIKNERNIILESETKR